MKEIKVAIIGGGPSGLVTLKTVLELADRNPGQIIVRASLFEAEDRIGGTFLYRSYGEPEPARKPQWATMKLTPRFSQCSPRFVKAAHGF